MFGIAHLERAPVTLGLLVAMLVAYLAQGATGGVNGYVTGLGVLYGPAVAAGEWWRLLSWGFLHFGVLHIFSNAFLLYAFGPQLERGFGSTRFAIMYAGALFGSALSVMLIDWDQPTLGASGAVMGIAAALAVAMWLRGATLRNNPVLTLVALNLALPLVVPAISFSGHLGGAVAGVIMMWVLARDTASGKRLAPASVAPTPARLGLGVGAVVAFAALGLLAGLRVI